MNILKNRSANNKKNIYQKSNIFGSSNISFTFQKGMKSIDREDLYFNNYFKSRNNYFKFVKKEYYNFINGKININDYTIKGLGNNVKKRIEELYKETYGFIKLPLPYLHRISSNNNKAFQLLYVDKTNEIILIDLYHLLIPAADHEHNETIKNPKLHYEEVKNNRFDISNVFE